MFALRLISVIYSCICHIITDYVSLPKAILTAVYSTFLILLSIVLPGNGPPLICAIPPCWKRRTLKHTKRLHISLLIYTDGFSLISEPAVSQMSFLTNSLCYRDCYWKESQDALHAEGEVSG